MAFDYDPADRAAFRAQIMAHLAAALPDAALTWDITHDRQLTATFPDGTARSIWESNFYFSRGPYFSDARLLEMITCHLKDEPLPAATE